VTIFPLDKFPQYSIILIMPFFRELPIIDRAGTAFHSNQNVMKDEVTKMMPGIKTVVK
jgi:hypothetical protein